MVMGSWPRYRTATPLLANTTMRKTRSSKEELLAMLLGPLTWGVIADRTESSKTNSLPCLLWGT